MPTRLPPPQMTILNAPIRDACIARRERTNTPAQALLKVTLPMLRPAVLAAVALGFLISWAQVPLTLLVGRGQVATLPLEVFSYIQAGQDRFAAVGAILLILPPILALGAARLAARDIDVVPV